MVLDDVILFGDLNQPLGLGRCRLARSTVHKISWALQDERARGPRPRADRTSDNGVYCRACRASYSALLQPPLPSLCSGRAAARKAARSTSTTLLPSLRNSSASFCSEARIWSLAFAAASTNTSLKAFLSGSESFDQTWLPTITNRDSVMWPDSMMWLCTS